MCEIFRTFAALLKKEKHPPLVDAFALPLGLEPRTP